MTSDPGREDVGTAQAGTDGFVSFPAAEPEFSRTQVKTAAEAPGPHAAPGAPLPPVPPVAYGAQPGRPVNGNARTVTYGLAGLLAAAALVVGGSVGFIVGHSTGSSSQVQNGGPGFGGYGGPRGGIGGYGGFGPDNGNDGSGNSGSDNGGFGNGGFGNGGAGNGGFGSGSGGSGGSGDGTTGAGQSTT